MIPMSLFVFITVSFCNLLYYFLYSTGNLTGIIAFQIIGILLSLLIRLNGIKNKSCREHVPNNPYKGNFKCRKCGVELDMKEVWEPVMSKSEFKNGGMK